jgi:hypothetical protein
MSPSLPPLPSSTTGAAPPSAPGTNGNSPSSAGGSAFSGGLGGMQAAVQQLEAGYQQLAQMLPSLAPFAADAVSKLRMIIPAALSAGAQGQGQPGQAPSGPDPTAQSSIPPPPGQ